MSVDYSFKIHTNPVSRLPVAQNSSWQIFFKKQAALVLELFSAQLESKTLDMLKLLSMRPYRRVETRFLVGFRACLLRFSVCFAELPRHFAGTLLCM
jgi:hypothetical protein